MRMLAKESVFLKPFSGANKDVIDTLLQRNHLSPWKEKLLNILLIPLYVDRKCKDTFS